MPTAEGVSAVPQVGKEICSIMYFLLVFCKFGCKFTKKMPFTATPSRHFQLF